MMVSLCQSAAVNQIFSKRGSVEQMLCFEAALARAEASTGVIPASAAAAIDAVCREGAVNIDLDRLLVDARQAGNLAIPVVKDLTSRVRLTSADAARYVHWGATSQDVIDTATELQLRAFFQLTRSALRRCCTELETLTGKYRDAVMPGRTWLQHAVPVTFGLKTAGWLDTFLRHEERLQASSRRMQVLQFGGAAGTLASLGASGPAVSVALAAELGLELPAIPWHTQRDRSAEVATTCGLVMGSVSCLARDLSLMMQTEVGELSEPAAHGSGGSSTMPHKRNPVAVSALLTAGLQVPGLVASMLSSMTQEHERALGGWQAEWQVLPEIAAFTSGALEVLGTLLKNIVVHPERMRTNLGISNGLVFAESVSMALADSLGKEEAHKVVECISVVAMTQQIPFREALLRDELISSHMTAVQIDALLTPENYLGSASVFIDRVLEIARTAQKAQ